MDGEDRLQLPGLLAQLVGQVGHRDRLHIDLVGTQRRQVRPRPVRLKGTVHLTPLLLMRTVCTTVSGTWRVRST
jgi:hypothetical protein